MLAAMVEVAAERGAGNATVAHVVGRSGVSRRTFYEQFSDREECFLAAFDEAVQRIGWRVISVYRQSGNWRERMRGALIELLSYLDNDPVTGRLVIVETLGAGPRALERRGHVLAQIIAAVDDGRAEMKKGAEPPPLTAEGVTGGVLSLIHSRLLAGEALTPLLNPLMSMIVLPYLGPAAARRELSRPAPKAQARSRQIAADPLRDLDMRLTYRTIRVLLAAGDHPGASNRQVGDASGIRDPGQISKLLSRLERLGLVHNTSDPRSKGEPNAWTLTQRGEDVRAALAR